jgi:Lectin C-type domain
MSDRYARPGRLPGALSVLFAAFATSTGCSSDAKSTDNGPGSGTGGSNAAGSGASGAATAGNGPLSGRGGTSAGGSGNVQGSGGAMVVTGSGGMRPGGAGAGAGGVAGPGSGGTSGGAGSGGGALGGGGGAPATCPSGCTAAAGACFCQPIAFGNWTGAQSVCKGAGLNLITIHDKAQSDALAAVLAAKGLSGQNSAVFTGLNDSATEGTFVWVDGSTEPFRNWASGQPNNSLIGGDPSGEDCVVIEADSGWWDFPCSQAVGFICG